jgi:hydroxyacylglutathione hydrolase
MGIFTGDFIFVNSIGRPDLLEEAAGMIGTAEVGARALYQSVQRFMDLPDYLQIWPAHGAGSACGKGLGAIPSSTVGYEKRFNPALRQRTEQEFVDYILAEQPEAPKYFAVMKRVNKIGPKILGETKSVPRLSSAEIATLVQNGQIVDTTPAAAFAKAHLPGSLNITVPQMAAWGGWLIDYAKPLYLVATAAEVAEAARILQKIGVDQIAGYIEREKLESAGLLTGHYPSINAKELLARLSCGQVTLIDVRGQGEWDAGHIEGARHHFLGRLAKTLKNVGKDEPIVVQCQSGARSAIAASLLLSLGFTQVTNLQGGYQAWQAAGLNPVQPTCCAK